MNTTEILEYAKEHDIQLWADGVKLQLDAPKKAVTPTFRHALKQHKGELLKILKEDPTSAQEYYEERAAILEYDYGLKNGEAEIEAAKRLILVTCGSCANWTGSSPCDAGMNTSGDPIPGIRARLCGFHTPRLGQ